MTHRLPNNNYRLEKQASLEDMCLVTVLKLEPMASYLTYQDCLVLSRVSKGIAACNLKKAVFRLGKIGEDLRAKFWLHSINLPSV